MHCEYELGPSLQMEQCFSYRLACPSVWAAGYVHDVGTRISKMAAPAVIMKFGLSSLCANIQRLRRFQERPSSHSACEAAWAWRTLPHNIQGCWHVKGRSNERPSSQSSGHHQPEVALHQAATSSIWNHHHHSTDTFLRRGRLHSMLEVGAIRKPWNIHCFWLQKYRICIRWKVG